MAGSLDLYEEPYAGDPVARERPASCAGARSLPRPPKRVDSVGGVWPTAPGLDPSPGEVPSTAELESPPGAIS